MTSDRSLITIAAVVMFAATGSENLKKPQIRSYIDARLEAEISPPSEVLTTLTAQLKGSLADLLNENHKFYLGEAIHSGINLWTSSSRT